MTAMLVAGFAFGGLMVASCRWKGLWKGYGEELSDDKKAYVQSVLTRVGYTDLSNVELRHHTGDDIIGIGGGNNSLILIPRHFTAAKDDTLASLFPENTSHLLSSLRVSDIESNPGLRDKIINDYGLFVKTPRECEHLLAFSGMQMYKDDGKKLLTVDTMGVAMITVSVLLSKGRNWIPLLAFVGAFAGDRASVEVLHKASLWDTFTRMGDDTIKDAVSVSEAERKYNLEKKNRSWFGISYTSAGDNILFAPTCTRRLEFIEEYKEAKARIIQNRNAEKQH